MLGQLPEFAAELLELPNPHVEVGRVPGDRAQPPGWTPPASA
jgi:hypothetical protein